MTVEQLKKSVLQGDADSVFTEMCGVDPDALPTKRQRAAEVCDSFKELFGDCEAMLFSVGGRSEISGNHTDHNCGRVLAAAVNLDILAVAAPTDDGTVTVKSEGFDADVVTADRVAAPDESKFFTSGAIIAGMEKAFLDNGKKIGGFKAYTCSDVLCGSGLSSSAAFEVMVGNILNHLYNDGAVSNEEIAVSAQYAENVYFGKPCGLMDQTACAVGGFIAIDFEKAGEPGIKKVDFDLKTAGYDLCIVNTGGSHSDLNEDYASVPREMKGVAALLGKSVLRKVSEDELYSNAQRIRNELGDRALLRAVHFISENERVERQIAALEAGDTEAFLRDVINSGNSSWKYLQNVYTVKNVCEQGLSLALCMTERFFAKHSGGAWRVHGGGFAGTVQAFVPCELTEEYKSYMEGLFGKGNCYELNVRRGGALRVL